VTHSSTAIQTGAIDTGMFEVDAVLRQVGATAIIKSSIRLDHVWPTPRASARSAT
jgi:hypothetical protein